MFFLADANFDTGIKVVGIYEIITSGGVQSLQVMATEFPTIRGSPYSLIEPARLCQSEQARLCQS